MEHNKAQIISEILDEVPKKYIGLVKSAIEMAEKIHKGDFRISGDPFLHHPLRTALIVARMGLDTNSILAAILHNTFRHKTEQEIKKISFDIQAEFGEEVKTMVKRVNSLSKGTKSTSEPELITKYILRSSEDLRIIIIKLADKVDNARTLDVLPLEKQKEFAQNIFDIYSPLCTYLNIYDFKVELEEVAFKVLKAEDYKKINEVFNELNLEDKGIKAKYLNKIKELLTPFNDLNPIVYGRIKGHYSTYKKARRKKLELTKDGLSVIDDLMAFTILIDDEDKCFDISKEILQKSNPSMQDYEDYINTPKENGYRSIQIVSNFPDLSNMNLEIQIKTHKMHQYNTYGPASHIAYKTTNQKVSDSRFYWVKNIHKKVYEYQTKNTNKRSVPIYSDIFNNKVYIFTKDAELKELPIGATVLDFAFDIHTEVGLTLESAKVNYRNVNLDHMLRNGDVVEVKTSKKRNVPDREWLRYVRTKKAREAIEQALIRHTMEEDSAYQHFIEDDKA